MLLWCFLPTLLSLSSSAQRILSILSTTPNMTWTATGSSHIAQLSDAAFKSMLIGRKFMKSKLPTSELPASAYKDIPEAYDYRDKYPQCEGDVFDQGKCGGCWAFAATSTFSDRRCIAGKTSESVALSQQYQISCDIRNQGCNGGYHDRAWNFFHRIGVPTIECVGYTDEAFYKDDTVPCPKTCDDGSNITLVRTSRRGKNIGGDARRIMAAIYREGPVLTAFTVYLDFQFYDGGIYRHITGQPVGHHAVEIIGYGSEDGTDFWRIRNSWGEDWGEDGFFRIVRGTNECNTEEDVTAGSV